MGLPVRLDESGEAFLNSNQEASETPCLISDIRMTGMSGLEMHEHRAASGGAPPTIFVTAHVAPSLQGAVERAGALALLEKPCSAELLIYWIMIALDRT